MVGIVATGWFSGSYRSATWTSIAAGSIIFLFGFLIMTWAAMLFRRVDNVIRPFEELKQLVVRGPYRFTRNPMYLGMVLMLSGVALAYCNLLGSIFVAYFIAAIHYRFILLEEQYLEGIFGDDYREMKSRIARWL